MLTGVDTCYNVRHMVSNEFLFMYEGDANLSPLCQMPLRKTQSYIILSFDLDVAK